MFSVCKVRNILYKIHIILHCELILQVYQWRSAYAVQHPERERSLAVTWFGKQPRTASEAAEDWLRINKSGQNVKNCSEPFLLINIIFEHSGQFRELG